MTQHDDDDAFENGVLRDRARYRVPMHMRDGQSMIMSRFSACETKLTA
jgi:hypothetical protein